MTRRLTRSTLVAAALVAGVGVSVLTTSIARADDQAATEYDSYVTDMCYADGTPCRQWEYGDPALFYNFYVPNNCGGVPAQLYIAPRPVPPRVGHTYITYQPLMPHEFTYPHHRTYRKYYDCGRGMTRTSVHWYSAPVLSVVKGVRNAVRIAR